MVTPDSDWDEEEVPVKKRGATKRCVCRGVAGVLCIELIVAAAVP